MFEKTSNTINQNIVIKEVVGKGLVELIESGKLYSSETKRLLELYIKPLIKDNVDALVLGCTHYPYLIPNIREIVGNKMQIIDSGEAVARQTKSILLKNNISNNSFKKSSHQFYINKDKSVLKTLVYKEGKNIIIKEKDF